LEQRDFAVESRLFKGHALRRQETDGEGEKTRTTGYAVAVEDDVAVHENLILVVYPPHAYVVCVSAPDC